MPLELSPMLEDDIDDFGIMDELTMQSWTFARLMDTSGRPRREFAAEWARKDWGKDDKAYWNKVTDTSTGKMIAMAMWRMPIEDLSLLSDQSDAPDNTQDIIDKDGIQDSNQRDKQFWAQVGNLQKKFFAKHIGAKTYAYLHLLMTHSEHRRRGAGTMLVDWGCKRADELGIMCACTASSDGEYVYKKSGFETKEAVELDLNPFGVNEVELRRFMVREPRKAE